MVIELSAVFTAGRPSPIKQSQSSLAHDLDARVVIALDEAGEMPAGGTRLIETLGRQLRGDVQLTYEGTGFVYTFDVPMASLTSATA